MARVFTVTFQYQDEGYAALVSVSDAQADQPIFNVRLMDEDLYSIIPEGKLTFISHNLVNPASIQDATTTDLFMCVRKAIFIHLSSEKTTVNPA